MKIKRLFKLWSRILRDQHGNVAITFALVTLPLVIAVGAAVDYSRISLTHTELQEALDSAVLAAESKYISQGSKASAIPYGRHVFKGQTSSIGENPVLNLSFDADGSVSGSATVKLPMIFMGVMGQSTTIVSTTSKAASGTSSSSKYCIYLLDKTASQSLLLNSGANINAPNCQVYVDTTGDPAAIFNAGTTLQSNKICLRGTSYIDNGGTHPNLQTGCGSVSDPFAGTLPTPSSSTCSVSNGNFNGGTVHLTPGVYCGWFNFNGAPTVKLSPGLYVIKGGGWNVNGGTWTGKDVTFYFADTSKIQFNSGMSLDLSAPTSGTYSGILFYEAPGLSPTQFVFDDSVGESLNGLIYLPSRQVIFNSSSTLTSKSLTLVADTAIFNTVTWNLEPSSLSGSASGAKSVRLVR
jgi:hypothetical protein